MTDDRNQGERPPTSTPTTVVFSEKFWRNRSGGALYVEIKKFTSAHVIDVREWETSPDGKLLPQKRGVCLAIRKLPELKRAIDKAIAIACDLDLIEREGGGR